MQVFVDLISISGVIGESFATESIQSEQGNQHTSLVYKTKTDQPKDLIAGLSIELVNRRLSEKGLPKAIKINFQVEQSAASDNSLSEKATLTIVSVAVVLLCIIAFILMTMTNRKNEPVQPMNHLGDIEKRVEYDSINLPPLSSTRYVSFSIEREDKLGTDQMKKAARFQIYVRTEQTSESEFIHPTKMQDIHSSSLLTAQTCQPVSVVVSRV